MQQRRTSTVPQCGPGSFENRAERLGESGHEMSFVDCQPELTASLLQHLTCGPASLTGLQIGVCRVQCGDAFLEFAVVRMACPPDEVNLIHGQNRWTGAQAVRCEVVEAVELFQRSHYLGSIKSLIDNFSLTDGPHIRQNYLEWGN